MEDRFQMMLKMQRQLQLSMPAGDPMLLQGAERAAFIRDMTLACEDELHEALAETGWKPWASSRHVNADPMRKELVDAWHFFMNLMLIAAAEAHMTCDEFADQFTKDYVTKNAVNLQRQQQGYDGVSGKCRQCHRDLKEVEPNHEENCNG